MGQRTASPPPTQDTFIHTSNTLYKDTTRGLDRQAKTPLLIKRASPPDGADRVDLGGLLGLALVTFGLVFADHRYLHRTQNTKKFTDITDIKDVTAVMPHIRRSRLSLDE